MAHQIYLAGPFFTPEQLALVQSLEQMLREQALVVFSPRLGQNALQMNSLISAKQKVPPELRKAVFRDNCVYIDEARLVVAVIDDYDTGTVWEAGYAYRAEVPILTVTNRSYGLNLMLAECVIGHCKGLVEATEAIRLLTPALMSAHVDRFAEAVAMVQSCFKAPEQLREGPTERQR